ncbi:hypothetical protein ABBQ38_004414 [Trebouxia sp. C0009 RCD-2024]
MGAHFSKIGSDPYYANYERSFQRLHNDIDRLRAQQQSRLQTRRRVGHFVTVWSTLVFVLITLFAAWVLRQPEGTYTAQEHALRVSPIVIEPIGAYCIHCVLQWLLKIRDKRLAGRLKSLETKMKRMVHDLKDSTRFDKTQKLLEKYDPEYVPSSPNRAAASKNSTQFAASTPGLRHRNLSQVQGQANAGVLSPLAGLQRGVGAAGSKVVPLLTSLAGMVGDNPALMDTLKAAQSEAEKLRSQVDKLQRENHLLRARLGEGEAEPEIATPRMNMLGELDTVDAKQQGAASSADPVTPMKGSDNDSESSDQRQPSCSTVTTPNDANRARNQRTTARKRTAK